MTKLLYYWWVGVRACCFFLPNFRIWLFYLLAVVVFMLINVVLVGLVWEQPHHVDMLLLLTKWITNWFTHCLRISCTIPSVIKPNRTKNDHEIQIVVYVVCVSVVWRGALWEGTGGREVSMRCDVSKVWTRCQQRPSWHHVCDLHYLLCYRENDLRE